MTNEGERFALGRATRRDLTRRDLTRRDLLAGAVTSTAAFSLPAMAAEKVGAVSSLAGKALAVGAAGQRELSSGADVFLADVIKTTIGTRAELKLGQRTRLMLGGSTELRIVRYLVDAGGDIDLMAGAIEFERTGKPASTELRVRSAYGLIGVRGTKFFAGRSDGVFGVFVSNGAVSFSGGGRTVVIQTGEGSGIREPGAQPSTPSKWAPERVQAALKRVRRG